MPNKIFNYDLDKTFSNCNSIHKKEYTIYFRVNSE